MTQKSITDFVYHLEDNNNEKPNMEDAQDNTKNYDFESMKNNIEKREWRNVPYKAQNWGIWLHHMSAYVGKLKPAMAYLLVKYCSKKGDTVLDPFCGIGTVMVEAERIGREAIGNDLNPYAFAISRAKFDRRPINDLLNWVKTQNYNEDQIDISWIEEVFLPYYDPKTLKEISFFRDRILQDKQWFIQGCLLGILHGHRPKHLSAITSLVIPYKPKGSAEYREVSSRIIFKIKRLYQDKFPDSTNVKIFNEDSRELKSIQTNSIDSIITSPPYFNTLDYVEDNRLRMNFLGYKKKERDIIKKSLIQSYSDYLEEMQKVGYQLQRVLKPNKPCILVLGDHTAGKKIINTASEIEKNFIKIGFKSYGIIDDEMLTNKCIPSNIKRKKLDRILILENCK